MPKLIISLIFLVLSAAFSAAEEMPKYEGVYIRTVDGKLHQLARAPEIKPLYFAPPNLPNKVTISESRIPFYIEDLWNNSGRLPVIPSSEVKSIVINSRNHQFRFLMFGVHSEGYFGMQIVAREVNPGSYLGRRVSIPRGFSQIVEANWGNRTESFRVRNVDQFVTEYEFSNGLSNSIRSRTYASESARIDTYVLSVQTTDGGDHLFLTDSQASGIVALNSDARIFSDRFIQYLMDEVND